MTLEQFSVYFKEIGLTLGAVESFTGGLFASQITSISGASKFFKGSVVTYATEEKARIVGVPQDVISASGVVSKECAYEMASRGREVLNVDVCVSFTGNAGPSAMEDKPVGEIYIGVSIKDSTQVKKFDLNGSRNEIQNEAILLSFSMIKEMVKENFLKLFGKN